MPRIATSTRVLVLLLGLLDTATAQRVLTSTSFSSCLSNSTLDLSEFNATLNVDESNLEIDLTGTSTYAGNTTISLTWLSHGSAILQQNFDACLKDSTAAFCPASPGVISIATSQTFPDSVLEQLPDALFMDPERDTQFQFAVTDPATNRTVACIEAVMENGESGTSTTATTSSASEEPTASGEPSSGGSDDDSEGSADTEGASEQIEGSTASTVLLHPSFALFCPAVWLLFSV